MLLRKPCVADAPLMFRAYAQDPGSNPLSDLAPTWRYCRNARGDQAWVSRIWAACDVENHSSARALEDAGFSREGVLPGFQCIPTSRQHLVTATPMQSPAAP